MPSDTSSVIVLPIRVAPASSSRCTAQACRAGTGVERAQSGLPPPVGCPATSNRSLAAKVRPESGPPGRPSIWTRGPGTKALMLSSGMRPLELKLREYDTLRRVLVQIYETCSPEEAAALARLGVDHIGVLVGEGSFPRELPAARARVIFAAVPAGKRRVALSLSPELAEVRRVIAETRPDIIHIGAAVEL